MYINGAYPFEPFWDNDRWKYKVIYSNTVSDQHWGKLRLPKVFRKTYSITEKGPVTDKNVDREDIPSLFRDLKMKDVSDQYFQTVNVKIKLTEEILQKAAYCYLAVFGQQQWHPVEWEKISGDVNNQHVVYELNKKLHLLRDGHITGFQGKTRNSSQKAFIDIDLEGSYELSRIVYVPE